MDWEAVVVIVTVFGAVFGFGIYLSRKSLRSIRTNYAALSEKFGLELTQPDAKGFGLFQAPPYLFGEWEGRKASVQTVMAGLKDSRQAETAVHLETALREDCILVLRSKRGLNRLERIEFKKLVRVKGPGEEFDRRISIATNRPDWVSEKVTAAMCEKLLAELGETSGTILLVKGRLSYRETGSLSGAATLKRIEKMMNLLQWFADEMEG